jgi:uncharacterized protein YndB with AHSA1/START domain
MSAPSDDAPSEDAIVVEVDLEDPPEKVWRALTEPDLRDAWLLQGDESLGCDLIEADPERSVRYNWRDGGVDSEVSFEISKTADGGTRLRVAHSAVTAPVLMIFPRRTRPIRASARRPAIEMRLKWAA